MIAEKSSWSSLVCQNRAMEAEACRNLRMTRIQLYDNKCRFAYDSSGGAMTRSCFSARQQSDSVCCYIFFARIVSR